MYAREEPDDADDRSTSRGRQMSGHTLSQEEIAALAAAVRDGEDIAFTPTPTGRERRVVEYDFAAPIKLSPDQQYQLERLYEGYCRRATTRISPTMRTLTEMEVISVEQLSWSEAVQRLPEDFAAAIVVDGSEALQMMFCSDLPFVWHCTSRLLGGAQGMTWKSSRGHLTDIERTMGDVVFNQFVDELEQTWSSVLPTDMRSSGVRVDAGNSHLAPPREPTVLVTLEVRFDRQSHVLWLVSPYRTVEPAAGKLVQGYLDGTMPVEGAVRMEDALDEVEIEVRVEVGATHLPMAEVLTIAPGSLLTLDTSADQGMVLYTAAQAVFRVRPGRDGTRRALEIAEAIDPEELW
jgi:flagellar motor switch protein FliM